MGDVVPFQNKRRWTRPEDYGQDPDPEPPRKDPGRKRRWFQAWMFWLVAFIGIGLWVAEDPALVEPPSFLASEPETVTGPFPICGERRAANCVIDGDTFRIGKRSIRIIGIDAPETRDAQCDAEAQAGKLATQELKSLLNQGPFTMIGRIDQPTDKYGRELRAIKRMRDDGTAQLIADDLIASGKVRAYRGEFRSGWCGTEI